MSHFQCFSFRNFPFVKSTLTSMAIASILILTGCTGDSLEGVTVNSDNTANLAKQDAEWMKALGLETPTIYMIELKWDAPKTKTNGTPLSQNEIQSYRITYYKEGNPTPITTYVSNATQRVGIPVETKGTYRFEIVTIGMDSKESEPKLVSASL